MTVAGNIAGSAEGGRAGFIPFQLVMVSPFLVPVWLAGLLAPFTAHASPLPAGSSAGLRGWRLPISSVTARRTTSRASIRRCSGSAPPGRRWTLRRRFEPPHLAAAIAVTAAISGFIALPLLPERSLQGSAVMASIPTREKPSVGHASSTPSPPPGTAAGSERSHTAIFTGNYGEAGAIDVLGHRRGCRTPTAATTASANGASHPPGTPTHSWSATTGRRRSTVLPRLPQPRNHQQRRRPRQRRARTSRTALPTRDKLGDTLAAAPPLRLNRVATLVTVRLQAPAERGTHIEGAAGR